MVAEAPNFASTRTQRLSSPVVQTIFNRAGDEEPMATDGSHAKDSADAEKAETEGLFREVNERIYEVNAQRGLLDLPENLVCECARPECTELVAMNAAEYRGLRGHSTWFVIAPSIEHFFPEVERIVAKNGHYWVVEKHDGATRIAERLGPRG